MQKPSRGMALWCVLLQIVLPVAADCVAGWAEAPNGACWKVTQIQVRWFECESWCGGHALACIKNDDDNAFAVSLIKAAKEDGIGGLSAAAWIGNTQTSDAEGPAANWVQCPQGEEVSYTRWAPAWDPGTPRRQPTVPGDAAQPNDDDPELRGKGSDQDCAVLALDSAGAEAGWFDFSCVLPNYSCLCEYGAKTGSAYKDWRQEHMPVWMADARRQAAIIFGTATVIGLLPMLRFLRRRGDAETLTARVGSRVSAVTSSLGWLCVVFAWTPLAYVPIGIRAEPLYGDVWRFMVLWPFGTVALLLGVNKEDSGSIRCGLWTLFILNIVVLLGVLLVLIFFGMSRLAMQLATELAVVGVLLRPTFGKRCCKDGSPWTPEDLLRRIWFAARLWLAGWGLSLLTQACIDTATNMSRNVTSLWILSVACLLAACLPTAKARVLVLRKVAAVQRPSTETEGDTDAAINLLFLIPQAGDVQEPERVERAGVAGKASQEAA